MISRISTAILLLASLNISTAWISSPASSSALFRLQTFDNTRADKHALKYNSALPMALGIPIGKNYKTKWKKQATLVEKAGKDFTAKDKGLTGTVNIVFKSGESTLSTYASPGDPLRDVASQAGQFIKYGCGKGECGTCQALCGGKYVKPCVALVPSDVPNGEDYVLQVQATKRKAASSGKFYSVRSIIMGFWNNVLGMIGMAITRRAAKKNYDDRIEFEDMIAKRTREKKEARAAAAKQNK